jgi:hypothetical protein
MRSVRWQRTNDAVTKSADCGRPDTDSMALLSAKAFLSTVFYS